MRNKRKCIWKVGDHRPSEVVLVVAVSAVRPASACTYLVLLCGCSHQASPRKDAQHVKGGQAQRPFETDGIVYCASLSDYRIPSLRRAQAGPPGPITGRARRAQLNWSYY